MIDNGFLYYSVFVHQQFSVLRTAPIGYLPIILQPEVAGGGFEWLNI
ncbi:MAG: hypothetical protein QW543_05950 [Sulfolobales archaeon]